MASSPADLTAGVCAIDGWVCVNNLHNGKADQCTSHALSDCHLPYFDPMALKCILSSTPCMLDAVHASLELLCAGTMKQRAN